MQLPPPVLLAKSAPKGQPGRTLLKHTLDLVEAANVLFGKPEAPTRSLEQWLVFFKLPTTSIASFLLHLKAAALFHDLGKCNREFQTALISKCDQSLRHEHLSALILCVPAVRAWLNTQLPAVDEPLLLAVVSCHHLKNAAADFAIPRREIDELELFTNHLDFLGIQEAISKELSVTQMPAIPQWWPLNGPDLHSVSALREPLVDCFCRYEKRLSRGSPEDARLLSAVRAALIVVDAAASGLLRTGRDLTPWLDDNFAPSDLLTGDEIDAHVIQPRLAQISAKLALRGTTFSWSQFQIATAALPSRSLLLAPCGSGKTLAAWRWIREQATLRPAARVIFLYPTRATATEGFRDYVSWAPEADAALVHGTAAYDLQGMMENPTDSTDPRASRSYETDARLFALGFWSKRIFSATVDQFLSFTQYSYGSVCLLPLLADSIVVVDEVHSFDRGMFSAFKDVLRNFDFPCLAMTATLPKTRREELTADCGLTLYNDKPDDLERIASHPRYQISRSTRAAAITRVQAALAEGKRVLWVSNTVPRAQALACEFANDADADALQTTDGVPIYCYHSRYRLEDRKGQHQQVVDAFQQTTHAVLGFTTQVCEMSLDLDAQLLITEECPISALIQRMGRCNRRDPLHSPPGEIMIIPTESRLPYEEKWLLGVSDFCNHVSQISVERNGVSQNDLEATMSQIELNLAVNLVETPKLSQFLRSGPWASSQQEDFRDSEDLSASALLDSEVPNFIAMRRSADPGVRAQTDGFILPAPRKMTQPAATSQLPQHLRLVPAVHYRKSLGLLDPKHHQSSTASYVC